MGVALNLLELLGIRKKDNFESVLAWVNEERLQLGWKALAELPRGIPELSMHCVIARAFNDDSTGCWAEEHYLNSAKTDRRVMVWRNGEPIFISEPPHVAEFVRRFDEGKIPELIQQ